jgi:hypothetical protein
VNPVPTLSTVEHVTMEIVDLHRRDCRRAVLTAAGLHRLPNLVSSEKRLKASVTTTPISAVVGLRRFHPPAALLSNKMRSPWPETTMSRW